MFGCNGWGDDDRYALSLKGEKELEKENKKRIREIILREKQEAKRIKLDLQYRKKHAKEIRFMAECDAKNIIEKHKNMPIAAKNRLQELLDNASKR